MPSPPADLERSLAAANVSLDACLAVLCGNNDTSLSAIRLLLDKEIGFALCSPEQAVPPFCRHILDCTGSSPALRDNESWIRHDASYRGRFYTRTSGTTAASKLVVFSQAKLWNNARNCVDRFQLTRADRVAIPVPVWHMYGFGAALLPAFLANAEIDVQAESNVLRFLERDAAFQPTTVYLTPSFCHALARLPQASRRYRVTIAAGDRTPADVCERYEAAHGPLISLYGSTELGAVAAGSPDDSFALRSQTTGRPMAGVRVIQRAEGHRGGGDAELTFEHPAGGEGYADANGDVAPDETFHRGCLRSNDVGRLDDDGYLRIAGRSDHLVKRDGRFVAFSDVEAALLKNAGVSAVVVFSDGTTPRGARLTAVCVAASPDADPRAIRDGTRRFLPPYAVPDRVTLVDRIPRLPSGKPDRTALAAHVAALQLD
jgi:acyl-CoA synthetase (AMP-forming)/AMP-acid ligase II